VAAWREAYRGFGAKPQRTRNSLEALLRRAATGLPRVNRLTDVYNAVSVLHQVPVGGEDLGSYSGAPRLVRASGDEPFDTVADGATVVDHPLAGEVVWCDEAGVTCRRWNWRQARRTQFCEDTTTALFILDALAPLTDAELSVTIPLDPPLAHGPTRTLPELSDRETEVLNLMVQGWRNDAIAEQLGISVDTVKFHASNLFRSLGVSSRAEAIALAVEHRATDRSALRGHG
jgi:DNA-binding CsgD family transcriptional regulator